MTVFFICPKPADPSGGVWFLGRLAGMLPDAVVAQEEPFEVFWDAHPEKQGKAADIMQIAPPLPSETVVIPEARWASYQNAPWRKILFLQNWMWLDKR